MSESGRDDFFVGYFPKMTAGLARAVRTRALLILLLTSGLAVLLASGVLTLEDIASQGETLATFLWLAVLFALSGQLNELGFMSYTGERLASRMGGLSWPATYVLLIVLYVGIHYLFVSQSSLTGEAFPVEKQPGASPAEVRARTGFPDLAP